MTEAEWNASPKPNPLLEFLRQTGRASDRKLRLFVVACCRRLLATALAASALRAAVEAGERFADGLAAEGELAEIQGALRAVEGLGIPQVKCRLASDAAWLPSDYVVLYRGAASQAQTAALRARLVAALHSGAKDRPAVQALNAALSREQVALLRDVFGPLPFREVKVGPPLLTGNDAVVPKLARAAYDNRPLPAGTLDRASLLVLADALEDAGCTNAEVLTHLRSDGPHVRGCWALDLLLGRK